MMFRRGFTLIEVNLAMFVMAVGTLGLVSLYSLGYRENQQSNEDVQAAVVADKLMNGMVAALSSTNMTWSAWEGIGTVPSNGWGDYIGITDSTGQSSMDDGDDSRTDDIFRPVTKAQANTLAKSAFDAAVGAGGGSSVFDAQGMTCGVVVRRNGPLCSIAVRCSRRAATLVYQPLYYTEVYFQGLDNGTGGTR
jgi:prepilin-type N-terminal cleavage/methylation domain-containing protein